MSQARFMIERSEPAGGLAAEAAKFGPWFHNVHLPDGTETAPGHPLGDFPRCKWAQLAEHLPENLDGWSALDIGCNSGFYSIELARRGADVTALEHDPHFLAQARWSAGVFGMEDNIRIIQADVYDLATWGESYDLVLFMGVFYHLRYPLLALDLVSRLVKRTMVFQTLTYPGEEVEETPPDLEMDERERMRQQGWPKMAFIENSLAGDATNWWAPNHAAVEAMLRSAGFEITGRPLHETYLCRPQCLQDGETAKRKLAELRVATGQTFTDP